MLAIKPIEVYLHLLIFVCLSFFFNFVLMACKAWYPTMAWTYIRNNHHLLMRVDGFRITYPLIQNKQENKYSTTRKASITADSIVLLGDLTCWVHLPYPLFVQLKYSEPRPLLSFIPSSNVFTTPAFPPPVGTTPSAPSRTGRPYAPVSRTTSAILRSAGPAVPTPPNVPGVRSARARSAGICVPVGRAGSMRCVR